MVSNNGSFGQKVSFSAAVKQNRWKWELQLPVAHVRPSSFCVPLTFTEAFLFPHVKETEGRKGDRQ